MCQLVLLVPILMLVCARLVLSSVLVVLRTLCARLVPALRLSCIWVNVSPLALMVLLRMVPDSAWRVILPVPLVRDSLIPAPHVELHSPCWMVMSVAVTVHLVNSKMPLVLALLVQADALLVLLNPPTVSHVALGSSCSERNALPTVLLVLMVSTEFAKFVMVLVKLALVACPLNA